MFRLVYLIKKRIIMKRNSLLLIFLIFYKLNAQNHTTFGIINDNDGFTNIRSDDLKKVIDKIKINQVFAESPTMDEKNNSVFIEYPDWSQGKKKIEVYVNKTKSGYIDRSRVKYLSELPQFKETIVEDKSIIFSNKNTIINVKIGIFDKTKHKIKYTKDSDFVEKIDGFGTWGTDGVIFPNLKEIKSITINYNGKLTTFPKESLRNLFLPSTNPDLVGVAESTDNTLFLYMSNGDGDGGYNVVWTIKNGIVISQYFNVGF